MQVRRRFLLFLVVTLALVSARLLRPAHSAVLLVGPAAVQAQAPSVIFNTGDTPTPAPSTSGRHQGCVTHGAVPRSHSRTTTHPKTRPSGKMRPNAKTQPSGKTRPKTQPSGKTQPSRKARLTRRPPRRPAQCAIATFRRRPIVRPSATVTSTITPSITATPTDIPADTDTATPTDVPANTDTPTPTDTATPTDVPTDVPTDTATPTPTDTATPYPSDVPVQVTAIPQAFFPAGGQGTVVQSIVTDLSVAIQREDATIVDGTGAVIKDLGTPHTYDNPAASQIRYWLWDGTNFTGTVVSPGAYTAVVLVQSTDGKMGIGTLPLTVQSG
jgi:hypothetical protein